MSREKKYEEMTEEEKAKVWSNSWNMLQRLNFSDEKAVDLLTSMYEGCVENRADACKECKKRHDELDLAEESAVYLFNMWNEDGKGHNFRFFIRSKKVRSEYVRARYQCPSCGAFIPQ